MPVFKTMKKKKDIKKMEAQAIQLLLKKLK